MSLEIEEIETNGTGGWSDKKKFQYEYLLQLTQYIADSHIDITGNLGTAWATVGFVCGQFSELGRAPFHTISALAAAYNKKEADERYTWYAEKSKLTTCKKLIDLCKDNGINSAFHSEPDMAISVVDFMDDEATDEQKNDAKRFGIYEKNYAYYSIELKLTDGQGYSKQETCISNFSMRIKYMIKSRKRPLRVIEIRQQNMQTGHVTIETVEVDTSKISNAGKFDEFVQGIGPYKFYGTPKHFTKLQLKYFSEERSANVVDVLGSHKDGIYFFNNGAIENGKFIASQPDGIVTVNEKIYYIPSGNEANLHDDLENMNERKFAFNPSEIKFEQWGKLFNEVYGNPGMVTLSYACACLFSDIIFSHCRGFVMPYLFGSGSSGKGSLIRSSQHLWGTPQDPANIPSKGNTDKGKMRKLAQFKNAMVLLEEAPENPADEVIDFLKAIWDRMGNLKAVMDFSFKTTQTPINSGVMLTSNHYPKWSDPLLMRLLVIEVHKNDFTEAEKEKFLELTGVQGMEEKGITSVTAEILSHRKLFMETFPYKFNECYNDVSPLLKGVNVKEDRMIKNVAMILATFKILSSKLTFPHTYEALRAYMVQCMQLQQSKRTGTGKASNFWMVFLYCIKYLKLRHGIHFDIDGNKLSICWMECYTEYLKAHREMLGTNGSGRDEMADAIKTGELFLGEKKNYRFKAGTRNTSVIQFEVNKLADIGFDVIQSVAMVKESFDNHTGLGVTMDAMDERNNRITEKYGEHEPEMAAAEPVNNSLFLQTPKDNDIPF